MGAIGFASGFAVRRGGLGAAAFDLAGGVLPAGATLARASPGTRFNASGGLVSEAADVARFDYDPATLAPRGLLIEPAATNKQTNFNSSPTTSGLTRGGDAAATLGIVSDAAALAAAGLTIGNGLAVRLDNAAGTANAYASIAGASGSAGAHLFSVYVRGDTGRLEQSSPGPSFAASATYVRRQFAFSAASGSVVCYVTALPGQTLFFVLNQYEPASVAISQFRWRARRRPARRTC